MESVSVSVSLLAKRVGMVAGEVERALSAPLAIGRDVASLGRWITTGTGASEGPARLLAALLRAEGIAADFTPISSFAEGAPPGDVCVVVSQRLSPNARVPLARASSYARMLLVTTMDPDADARAHAPNVQVIRHGPREEDGLLLRVMGPAAANATVIRIAGELGAHKRNNGGACLPASVGDVLATSHDRAARALEGIDPRAMFDVAGLVTTGADASLCEGLRHKLLEGLGAAHPPVWDVCGLVHGPLQSFYERDATLVLLERASSTRDLTERLMRVLHPARHRVVRLRSPLHGPLALLDFDLQLDHLVVAALRARPRDLADWPGKGCDGALYELGNDARI